MLEKLYGIKTSQMVINLSIYFITIIPSYVFLYEYNKVGFWTILLVENIVTHYLFDNMQVLELVDNEIKPKEMMLLSISIILGLIMLMWALIRKSNIFWTIIITEVIYMLFIKGIKRLRKIK